MQAVGTGQTPVLTPASLLQPEDADNEIPEAAARPTADQADAVVNNDILLPGGEHGDEQLSNVLMAHAAKHSVFDKTEVLAGGWGVLPLTPPPLQTPPTHPVFFFSPPALCGAALTAGGVIGLMFAVLLILLLIYRMKKKDEGSYDLGRKPIYTKAPATEIYA